MHYSFRNALAIVFFCCTISCSAATSAGGSTQEIVPVPTVTPNQAAGIAALPTPAPLPDQGLQQPGIAPSAVPQGLPDQPSKTTPLPGSGGTTGNKPTMPTGIGSKP